MINRHKLESPTDGLREQSPPAKVFSWQIGIDFMQYSQRHFKLLFWMEGKKDGQADERADNPGRGIIIIVPDRRTDSRHDTRIYGQMDARTKNIMTRQ